MSPSPARNVTVSTRSRSVRSDFASAASLALSMELGFPVVTSIGAVLYVVAWLLVRGEPVASEGTGPQAMLATAQLLH